MAVSLTKVRDEAPQLVSLVKAVNRVSLDKGLNPAVDKAAVVVSLDDSGSAQDLYRSGEVQSVTDLVFAAGLVFDDDGSMPASFFSSSIKDLGEITLGNCNGFVAKQHPRWGGTSYVAAIQWVIQAAGFGHVNLGSSGGGRGGLFGGWGSKPASALSVKATAPYPTYAAIVTDGEPQDGEAAADLLVRASQLPIFFQFLGVGPYNFSYLRKLDDLGGRLIDNAGFYDTKEARGDQTAMLSGMLNEYPAYLRAARAKGLVTG